MKKIYSYTGAMGSQLQQWVGIELPTLWLLDNHTHHWATAAQNTNIQMYDKNTHTKSHTWQRMTKTGAMGSELRAQGLWGYSAFPKGTSAVTRRWTATPLVFGQSHSPLSHGCPEYKYKNVWQKHAYKIAYKCMTKTHTKSHTNVWQKPAYKCMKKNTHTNVDKNTHTNTHTNVWKRHAYICMTKTHRNVWKKYTQILERWTANYSAQGAWGALLKGTPAVTRRWTATPPAVSPTILLLSSEWGLNCQPSGYWTTTLTIEPRPPQIQIYKGMKKTRIKIRIQIYE